MKKLFPILVAFILLTGCALHNKKPTYGSGDWRAEQLMMIEKDFQLGKISEAEMRELKSQVETFYKKWLATEQERLRKP